jgi:hypothetical protein
MTVAASTNRTIGRLATRMPRIGAPRMAMTATRPISSASRIGTAVKTTFPGKVNRSHERLMTVI